MQLLVSGHLALSSNKLGSFQQKGDTDIQSNLGVPRPEKCIQSLPAALCLLLLSVVH